MSIKIGTASEFTDDQKQTFLKLLEKQGKVVNPTLDKIDACKFLAAYLINDEIVSIGAIKPKTISDFKKEKADLEHLQENVSWELGYCYTLTDHTKKGYSSEIVQTLLSKMAGYNLIASTEMSGSSMRRILEGNGFKQKGKTWKSGIHGGELGLFILSNSNK